jgi:Transglutaminase-like superfamily
MRLLRSFLHLSSAKRRLILQAVPLVAAVRVALWIVPFRMWRRSFARACRSLTPLGSRRLHRREHVAWAVQQASRIVPRSSCLTQSLATQVLLARAGHPSQLRIGVARGARGDLEAHAWVESGGQQVIGAREAGRYAPLSVPGAEWV